MKTITELEAMSEDELRVMLGKLAGWTIRRIGVEENPYAPHWVNPSGQGGFILPNFPANLNACHAVLHNVTPEQHSAYQVYLADLSGDFRNAIDAPAKERTIALILALQQP